MKCFVYTLYSDQLKKRYVGVTKNLVKRLEHHNLGLNRWSKRGVPWRLVYFEAYDGSTEAYKRERFLKSGKGRELLKEKLRSNLENVILPS